MDARSDEDFGAGTSAAGAKAKGRDGMIRAAQAVSALYDDILASQVEDPVGAGLSNFFTVAVQASAFAQSTAMAQQMDKLVQATTDAAYLEVSDYMDAVAWSKSDLFVDPGVINYGVHVSDEGEKDKKATEISDLVEILEDNLLYICIGGGALVLSILFTVASKLSRKRQVVKGYDEP